MKSIIPEVIIVVAVVGGFTYWRKTQEAKRVLSARFRLMIKPPTGQEAYHRATLFCRNDSGEPLDLMAIACLRPGQCRLLLSKKDYADNLTIDTVNPLRGIHFAEGCSLETEDGQPGAFHFGMVIPSAGLLFTRRVEISIVVEEITARRRRTSISVKSHPLGRRMR